MKDVVKMKMKLNKLRKYLLLYSCFFIYSVSTICAKLASAQDLIFKVLVFIVLEIGCLGLYAIIWQQVLKQFTLITAMSSKGVVVILNLVWSVVLFKEVITMSNIIGSVIIICGIWMVSLDE